MAARTHAPYNANDESLHLDYVIVARALQLSPDKNPSFFVPMELGFYDQIGQEMYFEAEHEWVPLAKLQKYRDTYNIITDFDGTNSEGGEPRSLNTVPNSLEKEDHDLHYSLLLQELQETESEQIVPPTNNLVQELCEIFLPNATRVVENESASLLGSYAGATGNSPYSAETQLVESTLQVSVRAQRPTQVQPGAVKPPPDSDLEDTADSEEQVDDM